MYTVFALLAGFVVLGIVAREWNTRTRLLLFLFIGIVVVYVTLK